MVQCPECKKEIEGLYAFTVERNWWTYSDGKFKDPECIEFEIEYWKCPLCHEKLDLNPDEESAQQFLDGEDVYDLVDRHSVNCYDCGALVDERDCIPGDEITGDGGSLCKLCFERRIVKMKGG